MSTPVRSISVIIAAYNGRDYIREALDSVVAQDFEGTVETIVVDDGSADDTADIAEGYEGVTVIRQANTGQSLARNAGLAVATGEAVVFLDQDDLLAPYNLSLNARLLAEDAVAAVAGERLTFRDDAMIPELQAKTATVRAPQETEVRSHHDILRGRSFVPPSVCLFRTEVLKALDGFRDFPMADDMDLYARVAARGGILVHDVPVVLYRRHGGNFSSNVGLMLDVSLRVLDLHDREATDDETRASVQAGRAHWIGLWGGRLPMEAVWALKDGRPKKALQSLALWARLGMPRRARRKRGAA